MTILRIDPKIQQVLPELTEAEHVALEESITAEGKARDPICVWREKNTIIDGHHRYAICNEYNLPYQIEWMSFDDEAEVYEWMLDNQSARRNLTPAKLAYLRGKYYNKAKAIANGKKWTGLDQDMKDFSEKQGVTQRTIRNDGKFAEAVDNLPDDKRKEALAGKIPRKEIISSTAAAETHWVATLGSPYRRASRELHRIIKEFDDISGDKVIGQYIATKMTRIKNNLSEAADAIRQCEPVEECDKCLGNKTGCNHCYGTGFLSRAAKESRGT